MNIVETAPEKTAVGTHCKKETLPHRGKVIVLDLEIGVGFVLDDDSKTTFGLSKRLLSMADWGAIGVGKKIHFADNGIGGIERLTID